MFNGFVKPAPLSYYGTTNERTYSAQADFALQARDEFCLFIIFKIREERLIFTNLAIRDATVVSLLTSLITVCRGFFV